jgi:hypothetical protein
MNYGEVKAQFVGLMNRRDLTSNTALQDTFLQQAITMAQRQLRVPAMETFVDVTWGVAYENGELPIPSDMLQLIALTYTDASTAYTLRKVDFGQALRARQTAGAPVVYARRASKWVLGPEPAEGASIRIDYFQEFPAMSAAGDENWLTTIGPDVIYHGACALACVFYKDNRKAGFEELYQRSLSELQLQADADELTGSAQVSPAHAFDDGLDGNG